MTVLIDEHLKKIIDDGSMASLSSDIVLEDYIQPASMDLPIGDQIYHVKQKFLPFQRDVSYVAEKLAVQIFDAQDDVVLYRGQTYVIPCLSIDLPVGVTAKISPKSSIGRIDVLVRTVFDQTGLYDTVLEGTKGQLWMEVTPQSFNISVKKGVSLSQIMLFENENTADHALFSTVDEDFLFEDGARIDPTWYDNNLLISVGINPFWSNSSTDTTKQNSLVGYKARYTNNIIDLTKPGTHSARHFFDPVFLDPLADHYKLVLEKDTFYILTTKEAIRVPIEYSMELMPSSHLMGELRVHYAGFFDPGWGGETGRVGVLEVRPYEDLVIYDGQPVCLAQLYKNKTVPNQIYGTVGNNYHKQEGPKLAKYFY